MKKVFSYVIAAVLSVAFSVSVAFADTLSDFEETMLRAYLEDTNNQLVVRLAYWNEISRQANNLDRSTPLQISQYVYITSVKYDGEVAVNYTYLVEDPTIDLIEVKKRLVNYLCQDPQGALFLTIFDGELNHFHYLNTNPTELWGKFHISGTDCGQGI